MEDTKIEITEWTEAGLQDLFMMLKNTQGLTLTISHNGRVTDGTDMKVIQILSNCGIAANLKGHRYLRTAIDLCIRDRSVLDGVTKLLYPAIAKEYNVDIASVEHGIRHAIGKAWSKDNGEYMRQFFGNSLRTSNSKPTNSAFVATVVDYLEYYAS